jgi:hypothetical protein
MAFVHQSVGRWAWVPQASAATRRAFRPAFALLAWLEEDSPLTGGTDLLASAGIACQTRAALLDPEDAGVPQLDAAVFINGLDDQVKGLLDYRPRLDLRHSELRSNPLGDILLRHLPPPFPRLRFAFRLRSPAELPRRMQPARLYSTTQVKNILLGVRSSVLSARLVGGYSALWKRGGYFCHLMPDRACWKPTSNRRFISSASNSTLLRRT